MRNDADWVYLPQGEERVVAKLIKERSRLDATYLAKQNNCSLLESNGSFDLAEMVLCTYIDLDRLIGACKFSISELRFLRQQMQGATLADVAEAEGKTVGRVERNFRNMVSRITHQHEKQWTVIYGIKRDKKRFHKNARKEY